MHRPGAQSSFWLRKPNHARDLIRDLKNECSNGTTIVRSVPHGNKSKEARLDSGSLPNQRGSGAASQGRKSLDLLLHQLRQFPNGKHDDLVDSFTQALRVLPTLGVEKPQSVAD